MHRLLVISIALAIGCRDEEVARLETVRATVCKCDTATCAKAAIKLVTAANVESNARTQRIARDMLDCLAKLEAKPPPTKLVVPPPAP